MEELMEQRAAHFNTTTGLPAYSVLIPFVLITMIGCLVVIVVCIRKRRRLEDLRHRLIPLYSYDPTEQEEEDNWGEAGVGEELTEPLYKDGKLSFPSAYGSYREEIEKSKMFHQKRAQNRGNL